MGSDQPLWTGTTGRLGGRTSAQRVAAAGRTGRMSLVIGGLDAVAKWLAGQPGISAVRGGASLALGPVGGHRFQRRFGPDTGPGPHPRAGDATGHRRWRPAPWAAAGAADGGRHGRAETCAALVDTQGVRVATIGYPCTDIADGGTRGGSHGVAGGHGSAWPVWALHGRRAAMAGVCVLLVALTVYSTVVFATQRQERQAAASAEEVGDVFLTSR